MTAFAGTIHIGLTTSIAGYHLPDGTFRYGLSYVSKLFGRAENYYLRLTKNDSKKLEALRGLGYTAYIVRVKSPRDGKRGASIVSTISFDDLCVLVEYEAVEDKNPKAIALLTASFKEVLRSRTREAFGLPEESVEQRMAFFNLAYEERERLLSEDREDAESVELFGDAELIKIKKEIWWKPLAKMYADSSSDL